MKKWEKYGGLTRNEYTYVHNWLRKNYGKADKCENKECKNKSNTFHWALIKGCNYDYNRANFFMLCAQCHSSYDFRPEDRNKKFALAEWTDERKRKIGEAQRGREWTEEQKKNVSIRYSGSGNPMYGISIKGEDSAWWGKNHTEDTRKKISLKNRVLDDSQVFAVREAVKNGYKQTEISKYFGLSRSSINRIVKNRRYVL